MHQIISNISKDCPTCADLQLKIALRLRWVPARAAKKDGPYRPARKVRREIR
jgi:hypothetical protein